MELEDRGLWLDALRQGREDLLEALEGVAAGAAVVPPQQGRWSVLEIVEHVALAEAVMLDSISNRTQAAGAAHTRQRERLLLAKGASRKRKFDAPDVMIPTGRFATLDRALAAFLEARAQTEAFLASSQADLRALRVRHPVAGEITAAECLALLAVHPGRHALQIREMRSPLVFIRPPRESDAELLFPLVSQSPLTDWLVWDGPESFEQYRAKIAGLGQDTRQGRAHVFTIVETLTGRPIGNIDARPRPDEPAATTGLWIGEAFHGKGYGTAAIGEIVRHVFDRLSLTRVDAFVFVGNIASRRAFEKNGFALVETLREAVLKKGRRLDEWRLTLHRRAE